MTSFKFQSRKLRLTLLCALAIVLSCVALQDSYSQNIEGENLAIRAIKQMAAASENFIAVTKMNYPTSVNDLVASTPFFLAENYCGATIDGFAITCVNARNFYEYGAYSFNDTFVSYTFTTGGVFTSNSSLSPREERSNNIAKGKLNLKVLASASENYKLFFGIYPSSVDDIVEEGLLSSSSNVCESEQFGFNYQCENDEISYKYVAKPRNPGKTGVRTYQITTGFVLVP